MMFPCQNKSFRSSVGSPIVNSRMCLSTHGACGYMEGSYWSGEDIICGGCGYRIKNPPPTGAWINKAKGWRGFFRRYDTVEPKWPDFILGTRVVYRER